MITTSMFKAYHPPSKQAKALERVGAPNLKVTNAGAALKSHYGFQGIFVLDHLQTDFLAGIGGQLPSGGGYSPRRYMLDSYNSECVFSNLTTASTELDIYDIVVKRDIQESTTFTFNGTAYPMTAGPDIYWIQGVQAMTFGPSHPANDGSGNANMIGSTPTDSQPFRDYYRIARKTHVVLPQGASHRHWVILKPNRVMDESLWAGAQWGLAGLTMYTLIVSRGTPCGDLTDDTATTALTNIGVVQSIRTKYTFVADISNTGYYADGLTTPAEASMVNVGSGEVEVISQVAE